MVAWHFERIWLVGIPGTVVAGPLVALAIPGLLFVLLAGPLSEPLASFLAGGTERPGCAGGRGGGVRGAELGLAGRGASLGAHGRGGRGRRAPPSS